MNNSINQLYFSHLQLASHLSEYLSNNYNGHYVIDNVNLEQDNSYVQKFLKQSKSSYFVSLTAQHCRGFIVSSKDISHFFCTKFLGISTKEKEDISQTLLEFISLRLSHHITTAYKHINYKFICNNKAIQGNHITINSSIESFYVLHLSIKSGENSIGELTILFPTLLAGENQ